MGNKKNRTNRINSSHRHVYYKKKNPGKRMKLDEGVWVECGARMSGVSSVGMSGTGAGGSGAGVSGARVSGAGVSSAGVSSAGVSSAGVSVLE